MSRAAPKEAETIEATEEISSRGTSSRGTSSVDRSSASASFSRPFFVGMALFMTAIVFTGFWPSYFGPLLSGEGFEGHWIIHIHASVFLGWMAALFVQATLVAQDWTHAHMKLGRYGFVLGVAVVGIGLLLTFQEMRRSLAEGVVTWLQIPTPSWPPLVDMVQFPLLLGLGFYYRKRPGTHKRFMLFATAVLLHAATARMAYLLGPWSVEIMLAAVLSPIVIYDHYTRGHVHPATLIGMAVLLVDVILRALGPVA